MLDLPVKFKRDTLGKDNYLIPLVVINDEFYISTNNTSLKVNAGPEYAPTHFDPLLQSVGNIRESIDLENKSFKISSVDLKLFNVKYNETFLVEKIFLGGALNKKLDIYYKSQSAESLDDCLLVYTGYIKEVVQGKDIVTIGVEDRTEATLHKDLPIRYTPTENLPDKHKNKPIPIVYGYVDQAPLVYSAVDIDPEYGINQYRIIADDKSIYQLHYPYLFIDKQYLLVKSEADLLAEQIPDTIFKDMNTTQYSINDNNELIVQKSQTVSTSNIDTTTSDVINQKNPISFDMCEVQTIAPTTFVEAVHQQRWETDFGEYARYYGLTNILAFQDEEGTIPATNTGEMFYLMPKVFGGSSSFFEVAASAETIVAGEAYSEFPTENWITGYYNQGLIEGQSYTSPYGTEGTYTGTYRGYTVVEFSGDVIPGGNDHITELFLLPDSDTIAGDTKAITFKQNTLFNITAKYQEIDPQNAYRTHPRIAVMHDGYTGDIQNPTDDFAGYLDIVWNMGSTDSNLIDENDDFLTDGIVQSNAYRIQTVYETTAQVSAETVSSSFKIFDDPAACGIFKWFYIDSVKLKTTLVLKGFNKNSLFGRVYGRVDDTVGTYTGTPQTRLSEQSETYRDRYKKQIQRRNIVRPRNPIQKLEKKTTSTYGGSK